MSEPRVALIVPTFERSHLIGRLIAALEAQTLPRDQWEAVIVDDGSGDDTPAVLAERARRPGIRLRTVRMPVNGGVAAARNRGAAMTSAPLLAFIDDDCVPEPSWLESGVRCLERDDGVGIVQGRIECGPIARSIGPRSVVREVLEPSPWFQGGNLFVRRQAFEAAGGFDEDIGPFGEDTSLGWAIVDGGWRRGWEPSAAVQHGIEERPLRWHLRNRWFEGNLVRIAARHPAMRDTWWRRWAINRQDALFAIAVLGVVAALVRRPAILLALPYLRGLPRRARGWRALESALFRVSCDATGFAGRVLAGARCRLLVV